jgi:hypothetical protein
MRKQISMEKMSDMPSNSFMCKIRPLLFLTQERQNDKMSMSVVLYCYEMYDPSQTLTQIIMTNNNNENFLIIQTLVFSL